MPAPIVLGALKTIRPGRRRAVALGTPTDPPSVSSVWNLICFQGCTLCPGSPPSCGGQPRDADGQPRDHGHFMGDSLGGLPSLRLEALEARELGRSLL